MSSVTRTVKLHKLALSLSIAGDDGKVVAEYANPRSHSALGTAEIAELAADIKTRGLQVPILVRRVTVPPGPGRDGFEGEHELVIDGQRRYMALKSLYEANEGSDDVQVVGEEEIVEFTSEVATACLSDALAVGVKRAELSSYELASAGMTLKANNKSHPQIAFAVGRSETWVSKILGAYKKATQPVLDAWREGKITDEQFKELAGAGKGAQADVLAEVLGLRASGDKAGARATAKI